MRRVDDPSSIGVADQGSILARERSATGAESEVYVHVLEVTFFGEYGWTSVHRTYDGAWARLNEKVDEYHARAAFEADAKGQAADGDEGDAIVWGISYLPVLA